MCCSYLLSWNLTALQHIIKQLWPLYTFSGDRKQAEFPGLTRGLVAVLLYFDGQKSLVNSLRSLLQCRDGRTWTMELSPDLSNMIMQFTDQLIIKDNLVNKILGNIFFWYICFCFFLKRDFFCIKEIYFYSHCFRVVYRMNGKIGKVDDESILINFMIRRNLPIQYHLCMMCI